MAVTSWLAWTSGETIAHFFRAESLYFFLIGLVVVFSTVTRCLVKIPHVASSLLVSDFLGENMLLVFWFSLYKNRKW